MGGGGCLTSQRKKVCEGELHCFWKKFQEKIDDHIKQKESKKKKKKNRTETVMRHETKIKESVVVE